jgi:hypothetical protein
MWSFDLELIWVNVRNLSRTPVFGSCQPASRAEAQPLFTLATA